MMRHISLILVCFKIIFELFEPNNLWLIRFLKSLTKDRYVCWAVVVAQLIERSLPMPEVGHLIVYLLSTVLKRRK